MMTFFDFPRITICGFLCMVAGLAIGWLAVQATSTSIDGYGLVFRVCSLGLVGVGSLLFGAGRLHNLQLRQSIRAVLGYICGLAIGVWGLIGLFATNVSAVPPITQRGDLTGIAIAFFVSGAFVVIANIRLTWRQAGDFR